MKVKVSLLRSLTNTPNYGRCLDWLLTSPPKPLRNLMFLKLRNQLQKEKQHNRIKMTKLRKEMNRNCHLQKFQLTRRSPNYNLFPVISLTKPRTEPKKGVGLKKHLQQKLLTSP